MEARRIFVEKKAEYRVEAESLLREFNENLSLSLKTLRLLNVYDLFGFSDELLGRCRYTVFAEAVTDTVYDDCPLEGKSYLAVEYLPGQFDQRASSAIDCVHLIAPDAEVDIRSSRLLIFDDGLGEDVLASIRHYFVNTVESRVKDLGRLRPDDFVDVRPVEELPGFTSMDPADYAGFCSRMGLAMSAEDLGEAVAYFRSENREPTGTELRIIDTYWSDHCRHTTFTTELEDIEIEPSFIAPDMECSLEEFRRIRHELGRDEKSLSLMELATIGARYLHKVGKLDDLEQSEENNACSIHITAEVDGKPEDWLLMFKNETHNHPTEIEPFGGASTCIGGAIRDPLSGRAYVYQAMRVTGAGDIAAPVSSTLPGKLPQSVITRKAAAGYSSYGNQIGLATTCVREIYHPGYTAKRLETGAVVGAVKADCVRRESPVPGDVILLLGGRTGRDGIGGATGSSKEHSESSLETCGSEVQKGNAPEERKLQRLFRRPEVANLIKKSNDFGAGGVSVAIGELAPGLDIHLERVPVKYSGLNATELAISESQERMAVVIAAQDKETFEAYCDSENVEVTHVADVTGSGRMRMFFGEKTVADLSRTFIDSAGAKRHASARLSAVEEKDPFVIETEGENLQQKFCNLLSQPNVASQKGLVEMFDSSIGRSTVLMPYGGMTQNTPAQVSVQKLPVDTYTDTASMMAFGYNPYLSEWSPYHGAAYAVVEACAKVVAAGGDWKGMRFSYQEYFERMTREPQTWGKPLAALLGALKMQLNLGLPSIGGKDSMSGTFEHISVPPTLIAFGVAVTDASDVISPELKWEGNKLYLFEHKTLDNYMPDEDCLTANWNYIHEHILSGDIVSAYATGFGGVAEALTMMAFGNEFGVSVKLDEERLFRAVPGSIVVESSVELNWPGTEYIGEVTGGDDACLHINGERLPLARLAEAHGSRYSKVFPTLPAKSSANAMPAVCCDEEFPKLQKSGQEKGYKPKVFIPVFPGTNCDYDTAKAFRKAGAEVNFGVFRNLNAKAVQESIEMMSRNIAECDILALAGGFSVGDEPDGSGKFIANVLTNSEVAREIEALLARRGLILGICNGFQALIKSGLLPYGKPGSPGPDAPTLFRNDINRHVSQMVLTRVERTVPSPWLAGIVPGTIHAVPVSHGEGKFVADEATAAELLRKGQVAFRYVDPVDYEPTQQAPYNPNGSVGAIEGLLSPDGLILGKMGHSERYERNLFKNIPEDMDQGIFENAVRYFSKA